jgi:hypothetical protein
VAAHRSQSVLLAALAGALSDDDESDDDDEDSDEDDESLDDEDEDVEPDDELPLASFL